MTVLQPGMPDNSQGSAIRDVSAITLPTDDFFVCVGFRQVPWTVRDTGGVEVPLIREFLLELVASDLSSHTVRAYALDLSRWYRFLKAVGVTVEGATRTEVRDLVRWIKQAPNPQRRRGAQPTVGAPGSRNPRTGKPYLPQGYAKTTINRQLSSLRSFYDFLVDQHGLLMNPVPHNQRLFRDSGRVDRTPTAHRSPMERRSTARRAPLRQSVQRAKPRGIAPQHEEEIFSDTTCTRDWAILFLALWSGPRAQEILSIMTGGLNRDRCVVSVARKNGAGAYTDLPVPPVWFEFVDAYLDDLAKRGVLLGPDDALWRTVVGADRSLNYESLRGIFRRIGLRLNLNYTLHDFRHAAATRMADDPENLSLVDVQAILGHASLDTTGLYTHTSIDALATAMARHYTDLQDRSSKPPTSPDLDYDQGDLGDLLGGLA